MLDGHLHVVWSLESGLIGSVFGSGQFAGVAAMSSHYCISIAVHRNWLEKWNPQET